MSREKKFTPGPWEARYNGFFYDIKPAGDIQNLASTQDNSYLSGDEEANANLIAAAPELLEALESVCQNCLKQCQDCPVPSAIKKAYGETE